jgi:hypothetical protein
MTATIIPFPTARRGRSHRFAVVVTCDGLGGWYVIREPRGHGWLHGDIQAAFADAQEMASADAVAVEVRS